MNIFSPSITHAPSAARARVRVLPASDPASGSVSPNAAERAAAAQVGQEAVLLLLAAEEQIGDVPREVCAATVTPSEGSTRVSSSTVIA